MRLELVVAAISTFQVYHQAASSTLVLLATTLDLSSAELTVAATAFPLGKFFGTLAAIPLHRRFGHGYTCLDACALGLALGSLLMLLPS